MGTTLQCVTSYGRTCPDICQTYSVMWEVNRHAQIKNLYEIPLLQYGSFDYVLVLHTTAIHI